MPPRSRNQSATPADQWNQFYGTEGPGGYGFTDGILKLNQIFSGNHILEPLALGYIDADDQQAMASMYMRGIRQLQHPAMRAKYGSLFDAVGDDGDSPMRKRDKSINPLELPFYLQVTLSLIATSNSVNGRGQQRRVDMHTQYNSIAAIRPLAPPIVQDAYDRNSRQQPQQQQPPERN